MYVIQWAQKRSKRYFGIEIDKLKENPELARLLVDEYKHLGLKFMTKYKALSNKAKKEFCDELNTNPDEFVEYMKKYEEISKKIFMEV
jgi:predicted NACHT family NTPase